LQALSHYLRPSNVLEPERRGEKKRKEKRREEKKRKTRRISLHMYVLYGTTKLG